MQHKYDPKYHDHYLGLGRAYKHDVNLYGAIYFWEKALEVDPGFSKALFDLATAYINTDNKDKAFYILSDFKKRGYQILPAV